MGYDAAINLAEQKLSQMQPSDVCEACGARYENGEFFLRWFNMENPLSTASVTLKILWLHYLAANGSKNESGQLIAYREIAPALFYEPNFYKRAVKPLIGFFGSDPQKLIETGIALGGEKASSGDVSVKINVLPYLPVIFIIWEKSEEFPPDGNILFDKTAKTWFAAEDLAVLAGAAVQELINACKNGVKKGESG
ncbi:MAG: DUF3786 domain-containing protein [Treponema sp.]|nr:DUF3786 domain-containing protein [Treponema sp.]